MSKLDFADFFHGLWGFRPFAWQCELANRVVSRTIDDASFSSKEIWPKSITLPTGAGKTACIDIAIFAMAAAASSKKSPLRRVFFVVDRRVIVDDAYGRAQRISQKLAEAKQGILKDVADHLLELNPQCLQEVRIPLAAFALRGGKPLYAGDNDPFWNPLQPAVIASTVDQVGSRLLFRGYGCSKRSRPIYAGLIAKDSLIILDEAHCSNPFMQTLGAINNLESKFTRTNLGMNTPTVIMSATPPVVKEEDAFQLDLEAKHEDVLEQRLAAPKIAELKEVKTKSLEIECADAAKRLVNKQRRNIVVFVNLVATARTVYGILKKEFRTNAVILTGRMRPLDKDYVVAAKLEHLRPENQDKRSSQDEPLFVISTQTLEVGADLDFDGLVSECSSLDSLRQRFGRLNRTGRSIDARAIILKRDKLSASDKYVYGEVPLGETWEKLNAHKLSDNTIDFGIKSKSIPQVDHECIAPVLDAPVMLPAHLDSLVQTEIEPQPSPVVADFLHGVCDSVPDVQVCWRADIDLTDEVGKKAAEYSLSLCPPRSGELASVPISVFRSWLEKDSRRDESTDIEGVSLIGGMDVRNSSGSQKRHKTNALSDAKNPVADHGGRTADLRNFVLLQREKEVDGSVIRFNAPGQSISSKDVSPGDVIVVQAHKSCGWERLADLYTDQEHIHEQAIGLDIADRASHEAKGIPILRLHKPLVSLWPDELAEAKKNAYELISELPKYREEDDEENPLEKLKDLLKQLSSDGPKSNGSKKWSWLREVAESLESDEQLLRDVIAGSSSVYSGLILVGKKQNTKSKRSGEVELNEHMHGVMDIARMHSSHSGLLPKDKFSKELIEAISLAGRLHDIGKADPRFQSRMRDGMTWAGGKLLAKANPQDYSPDPTGSRHELLSVQMIEQNRDLLNGITPELHDLVMHLIASHHGFCRPFAPETAVEKHQEIAIRYDGHEYSCSEPTGLEKLDSGVSERFWHLVREYGWWGLAWLEALFRLADWRRSSQE